MRVSLFVPCLVDRFLPQIGVASVRMLGDAGFEVDLDPRQTCCGQPAFNAGFGLEARSLARRMLDLYSGDQVVVCPSGSCVAMVRDQYGLLGLSEKEQQRWMNLRGRFFELVEFLDAHGALDALSCTYEGRCVIHSTCHHLRFIRAQTALDRFLARVQGLDPVFPEQASMCCGFGGVFSMKLPELSVAMGRERLDSMLAHHPDAIVLSDAGCILHLQGILDASGHDPRVPVLHYSELYLGAAGTTTGATP
jgi:L-lactate dehydrogenase complex protein LldE